jgi:hypothetical protein
MIALLATGAGCFKVASEIGGGYDLAPLASAYRQGHFQTEQRARKLPTAAALFLRSNLSNSHVTLQRKKRRYSAIVADIQHIGKKAISCSATSCATSRFASSQICFPCGGNKLANKLAGALSPLLLTLWVSNVAIMSQSRRNQRRNQVTPCIMEPETATV